MGDTGLEGSYWKKCYASISSCFYGSGEGTNGQQGGPVPCCVKEQHV